jgi:uncharacterized membrane protein HdeD (DUF308 family)
MATWLARYWWTLAVRGVVGILFGILTLIWPGITLAVLVILFGAYALVDGIFAIGAAISDRVGSSQWWALILEGMVGILIGLLTFAWPGITALVLLYLIGAWAIITGVLEIVAAIRLRNHIANEWSLGLAGVLSVLFGILMFVWPGATALALVWLIGLYALFFGVLLLALAFRLRGWARGRAPSAF